MPGGSRDRDPAGRPRNARPRDALGRPLPHGATAAQGAVPPVPDDLALSPVDSLAEAQRLLDAGRAFAAHEVLEAAWKAAPDAERDLWQGLAQAAVGVTHLQRGNVAGARTLFARAAARLAPYAGTAPYDIDAAGVAHYATQLAELSEPTAPPPLRLRLRR